MDQPNYGTAFPFAEITAAKDIIMAGEWLEQKSRLAKCEWRLQGYVQLLAFGDPDVFGDAEQEQAIEKALPNNDGVRELEQLIAACEACPKCDNEDCDETCEADGPGAEFDPISITLLIAALLPLAKKALEWVKKRRNPDPKPEPTP